MNVLAEGIGKVFTNPDADKAREFFRKKSRKLESKVMTVKEAVEKFTKDGDYLVDWWIRRQQDPGVRMP